MAEDTADTGGLVQPDGDARGRTRGGRPAEPDVLLDVPELRVEEIVLDVEDLHAHVSVEANVLDLLRLSVGADVQLGGVHLEIRGVEAQALLKVRLNKIAEIIERVLTTIDQNPDIVGQVVGPLETATGELAQQGASSVDDVTGAVTTAAQGLGGALPRAAEPTTPGDAAGSESPGQADEHAAGTSRGRLRRRRGRRKQEHRGEPPP